MSNLGQGYWERRQVEGTHTRDTGGTEKHLLLHTCFEFQPGFRSQGCGVTCKEKQFYPTQLSGPNMVKGKGR